MSTVDNPINSLDVTARTPDERVFGRMHGRRDLTVWLAPGYYQQVTEADLQWQFQRLGKLLFVSRMREYYRLRSLAFSRQVSRESAPGSERDHEFVERRGNLVAEGASPDGRVAITAVGMQAWTVAIAPDTVRDLDEGSFCAAMTAAGNALIADQFAKIRALKGEVFA